MNFKTSVVCAITTISLCGNLNAQSLKDKSIFTLGWSVYTDYILSPVQEFTTENIDGVEYNFYHQDQGTGIVSISLNYRYNLLEAGDEFAIGLNAQPLLGISIFAQSEGVGHFNLPLFASLDFGAGSTYNSTANLGGFIGAGFEYYNAPVFGSGIVGPEGDDFETDNSWTQPMVSGGIRYWGKKGNHCREISIKYGWGKDIGSKYEDESFEFKRSNTFRLAFVTFLNY